MEIQNYSNLFIDDAMKNLGEAFDYVANNISFDLDLFLDMFVSSGYAKMFENGNPKVIIGISGTELAMNIFQKIDSKIALPLPSNSSFITPEYWCGWILAYYQWKTGLSFKYIHSQIKIHEILKLYPTLHEASEEKFVAVLNIRLKSKIKNSRLSQRRKEIGLTQKELSIKSGVNLRTLQQYELKEKDINKASAMSVYSLANALNCQIEDILELI